MDAPDTKSLPENAYSPLAPGEVYTPIVPARVQQEEATFRSVGWGLFLCVVFTVASAYSGLKVGQVMEASIPISILAIGLARVFRRRSTLLENVIITNIGGTAGGIVAGAIFTLPALYILHLSPNPVQTSFILIAGGCLGVLFLIPLRRYFVRETHGQFPFPEATAITEVLVTGEKGGSQASLLLQATGIAAVYDFFVTTFQVWRETVDFQFVPVMKALADRARIVVRFDAISFILGLGYVMGLRSSMILCAGGFLSNFVLVPLVWMIGHDFPGVVYPGTKAIGTMAAAGSLPQLRPLHRRRRHRHGGHLRHPQVAAHRRRLVRHRRPRLQARRGRGAGAHRPRHADHDHPDRRHPHRRRRRDLLQHPRRDADRRPGRPAADPDLLVLLRLGGRQRHRHHGAQPGLGDDDADHHHLVAGDAPLRPLRDHRDVLRDGDRRHGLHGALGLRAR